MQLFLLGYIIIEICEIFTVGEFPLSSTVRIVSLFPVVTVALLHVSLLINSGLYRYSHRVHRCNNLDPHAERVHWLPNY